jgi:TonB family protein
MRKSFEMRRRAILRKAGTWAWMMTGVWIMTWLWIMTLGVVVPAAASVQPPSASLPRIFSARPEQPLWPTPRRSAEFSDVPHVTAIARCEDTQPPQALATPDPLLVPAARDSHVKVSFIIGADGRVSSPLILMSGGPVGDRNVLQTVRSWRYRPATCNGVPTETEGKIEFSRR